MYTSDILWKLICHLNLTHFTWSCSLSVLQTAYRIIYASRNNYRLPHCLNLFSLRDIPRSFSFRGELITGVTFQLGVKSVFNHLRAAAFHNLFVINTAWRVFLYSSTALRIISSDLPDPLARRQLNIVAQCSSTSSIHLQLSS